MNEPTPLVVLPSTRKQAHVADVSSTLAGIAGALAQLQLAGAPPDAAIAVTRYGFEAYVVVAADWEESTRDVAASNEARAHEPFRKGSS